MATTLSTEQLAAVAAEAVERDADHVYLHVRELPSQGTCDFELYDEQGAVIHSGAVTYEGIVSGDDEIKRFKTGLRKAD